MNINYHFYAVKAIARFAGFDEPRAQLIAEYSQFVDDAIDSGKIVIHNAAGAGYAEANNMGLVAHTGGEAAITRVQTGIVTIKSVEPGHRRQTIVPFHFIPRVRQTPDNLHTPVARARIGDGSIISIALDDAVTQYRQNMAGPAETVNQCLIRLGTLLHVFADTYAHQRFSGHWNGWFHLLSPTPAGNSYKISNVWRNTGYDTTDPADISGDFSPKSFMILPAIGHATAGHVPDISNITFNLTGLLTGGSPYTTPQNLRCRRWKYIGAYTAA